MRIGFFTYGIHGERMTGIARYTVELTRALKRVDPSLDIVLLNPYPESDHPWYQEFPTYPLPHLKKLPLAATLGNLELHRAAMHLELDVLHDPCGIAPFLAPRGPYARVTTVCDAIPLIYPETQPLLTRWVFQTLVRASGRTADAIITISRASEADLVTTLSLPEEKLHVTLLGAKEAPRLPNDRREAVLERLGVASPYFLYVGALHPRKNIRRTIQAFQSFRSTRPDTQLAIVGPPSWGASDVLNDVVTSTSRDQGIVFTGFVSDDDLAALYQAALALVFPSLYEGFGLPPLEAMCQGTPVITSDVSSLPEVVGDAGILVDPKDVADIASGMARASDDAELRAALVQSGRARCRDFTWEATARKTLGVYRTLPPTPHHA